jgi:hypothetical protein
MQVEGRCAECGAWSESLQLFDSYWYCANCYSEWGDGDWEEALVFDYEDEDEESDYYDDD